MSKITILNMPDNTAFEFSKGRYVWKVIRDGTRNGNCKGNIIKCTEIFRTCDDGRIECEWSGGLVYNSPLYYDDGLDKNHCFSIFSIDMGCESQFEQTKELSLAPKEITEQITALEPQNSKVK